MTDDFQQHIRTTFPQILPALGKNEGSKILVACSGGVDSVALVHLLHKLDYTIAIAHCNFSLRGNESDEDATFVENLANKLNVPFYSETFDTKTFAKDNGLSTQVAARELRYRWFYEITETFNYHFIATGHHADDDLETFLINLSRSTGLRGLTGIPEINDKVIRPLLPFSRQDILRFAKKEQLFWREDSSNKKTDYLRNKMRLEVIPSLKETNKKLLQNFRKTQEHLQESQSLVDDYLALVFNLVVDETEDGYSIKIDELEQLPNNKALLYELLHSFGFTDFKAIVKLQKAQSGKAIFSESHRLLKDRTVFILSKLQQHPEISEVSIPANQKIIHSPLTLRFTPSDIVGNIDTATIYVDADLLRYPLLVRKWREGDVFKPFGMKGNKKLSKFFKDEKLSLADKEKIWLLESDDKIVWVIGWRADDRFKVTDQTTRILKITTHQQTMKQLFATLLFFLFAVSGFSQILEPVKWTSEIEKTGEDTYILSYIAEIQDNWHLYDQQEHEDGPIPTTFSYLDNADKIELIGKATESESHTSFDKVFNLELTYFDHSATFKQKIKVLDPNLTSFIGEVSFQSCDDEKCIFDFRELEFVLPGKSAASDENSQIFEPVTWDSEIRKIGNDTYELIFNASIEDKWHVYSTKSYDDIDPSVIAPNPTAVRLEDDSPVKLVGSLKQVGEPHKTFDKIFEMDVEYFDKTARFIQTVKVSNSSLKDLIISLDYQTCDDEKCIFPTKDFTFQIPDANAEIVAASGSINDDGNDGSEDNKGLWRIFIVAFFSGFAALLTPCVFPMIPMTVSFFTKQSKTKAAGIRNAIIYGLSIIVIYVLLGIFVSLVFGADALNALSTNVWFNLIFFVLLIVFAASFLGAFEIMLPNSWANKVDKQADRGGLIGIFFMALALAIVSFSCTGPIVGTLLVEAAAGGSQIGPIVGMFGFALAIALPFALFAAFPGWLNSLPKSGGWLNTVKVVLGFLELALAFKFLSNADLVLQLHWLEREVFLAIWIAIFGALALYLFGKIRLPHDSPVTHISVGRLMLALLVLSFTVYMIPGLWGAPLKLISGFPPAAHYSESPYGVGFSKLGGVATTAVQGKIPEGAKLLAPHDILSFTDYDKGVAYAKEVGKPIMIDFTGHACVNCRKMEENVWPEGSILPILKNEVVLISLYVDEKKELPENEKYTSKETGKKVRTVGNKWSDLQITNYKANAQPYYVLMNHDEENLINPVGYTPDAEEYEKWLRTGISQFGNK